MVATSHAGAGVTMLRHDGKRFDIEDFSDAPTMDASGTAMLTKPSGGVVTVWSVPWTQHGEIIGHLVHPDRVRDTEFTADGRSIVTTSDDGVTRIWDAGVKLAEHNDFRGSDRFAAMVTHGTKSIHWHKGPAESVDIDLAPDGQTFTAVSPDGWVRLWSITPEPWVDRGRHGQWVGGIAAVPSTDTFITASDYYGRVWQLNPLRATRSPGGTPTTSPASSSAATAGSSPRWGATARCCCSREGATSRCVRSGTRRRRVPIKGRALGERHDGCHRRTRRHGQGLGCCDRHAESGALQPEAPRRVGRRPVRRRRRHRRRECRGDLGRCCAGAAAARL